MASYVVTGASRGIGLEFVRQLSASAQNTVFAIVRDVKTANRLQALERKNVHILEADVTDLDALKKAARNVSETTGTGGSLDMLINNAAIVGGANQVYRLSSYPEVQLHDDLLQHFTVNVMGVINTTNTFLPLLRAGKTKKVLTLGSAAGDIAYTRELGMDAIAPYSISKAALNMAIAKYALEPRNREDGFVFLSINPGYVDNTDTATSDFTPQELQMFGEIAGRAVKFYPDAKAISPEQSVRMMMEIMEKATPDISGEFLSHKGNKEWL